MKSCPSCYCLQSKSKRTSGNFSHVTEYCTAVPTEQYASPDDDFFKVYQYCLFQCLFASSFNVVIDPVDPLDRYRQPQDPRVVQVLHLLDELLSVHLHPLYPALHLAVEVLQESCQLPLTHARPILLLCSRHGGKTGIGIETAIGTGLG